MAANLMARPAVNVTIRNFVNANGGPRLIVGVLFVLGLQLIMLFSWLSEQTEESAIELAVIREEVAGMRQLLEANDLDADLAEAQRVNNEFARKSHQSSTAGLAAAEIQGQLTSVAKNSSISNLEVAVNVDGDDNSRIFRFIIDVSGAEQSPGEFALFLTQIMDSEVEYDAEMIFWEQSSGRFRMRLACVGSFAEDP